MRMTRLGRRALDCGLLVCALWLPAACSSDRPAKAASAAEPDKTASSDGGASCKKDSDCASGQRCGFTGANGCQESGICLVENVGANCFDPGGRCGCDGRPVDRFCAKGSSKEFASAPVGSVGPCPRPCTDGGGCPPSLVCENGFCGKPHEGGYKTAAVQQSAMTPDQANTTGWDKGWTNLVNDVEQTFTPSLAKLVGVEVELVVGNAGAAEDQLTLTVLDAAGRTVAVVTQSVQTAESDQVMFVIPNGGVEVTPGQMYRLKLSGGTTFGWKYILGGYKQGAATFNGKPLLPDERGSFLFRTFGAK